MSEQRAIRDRIVCVVESDDWSEIGDTSHPWVARVVFLTGQQTEEMNGQDFGPEPELQVQHPDDSDTRYEDLFAFSVIDIVRFAFSRGYLETVSAEQRNAIRDHVRYSFTEEYPTKED